MCIESYRNDENRSNVSSKISETKIFTGAMLGMLPIRICILFTCVIFLHCIGENNKLPTIFPEWITIINVKF